MKHYSTIPDDRACFIPNADDDKLGTIVSFITIKYGIEAQT